MLPLSAQLVLLLDEGLKANSGLKKRSLLKGSPNIFSGAAFSHRHPLLISVFSYAERGGPTWRRPGHISDTGTAGGRCVSCSGAWARPTARTSNHSPPSRSGTASLLQRTTQMRTEDRANDTHTGRLVSALRLEWPNLPHLRKKKRSPSCPAACVKRPSECAWGLCVSWDQCQPVSLHLSNDFTNPITPPPPPPPPHDSVTLNDGSTRHIVQNVCQQ